MNTSKTISNGRSWKPAGFSNQTPQAFEHLDTFHKVPLMQKKVTFSLSSVTTNTLQEMNKETEDPRNLGISRGIQRQFKTKPSSRFFPHIILGSETKASFINHDRETPLPLPPRHPKVHLMSKAPRLNRFVFEEDLHEPRRKLDALDEIKILKSRILKGENVPIAEIHAVRQKVESPQRNSINEVIADPIINRRPKRKGLFCEKGIVKVPTPNNPHSRYNSFGSPADLRISLSNSDTPEYEGRRRYFFDFTGFLDKDIKLFLEDSRRLIIQGSRSSRGAKRAVSTEDILDLPKDLPVDNLRIVRDVFGTLIVEEAWKFM